MTTMLETLTAREYQRVSYVAGGKFADKSPEEQHADNAVAADRHRWTLGAAYRDKVSASRYSRRVREDFGRLMDDLTAGRFAANILILWESSRGSRKVSEWCALIEACEAANVRIYVTSDGKLYDPADPRDRRTLQEDAVDAEWESSKVSKRVSRSARLGAAAGRPNGPPPFGYRAVYDQTTGKSLGREIDPAEAAIVRECYERVKQGHSLRSICADLEARGIRPHARRPRGTREAGAAPVAVPWTIPTLRQMLLSRAYIAERMHDPAGRVAKPSPQAAFYPAEWPPIVDRALWKTVNDRLRDEARTVTRPGRAVHWLSGIAFCDVCGSPVSRRLRREGLEVYACHRAQCVSVGYADLDAYAEKVLLGYLARDDVARKLTATATDPAALAKAEADIATCEQDIEDLADKLSTGGPAARKLLDRALPKIETRLAEAKARKDALTGPSRLRGLIEPGKDVARRWAGTPTAARREIARLVFVADLLGELRVLRVGKRWRTGISGSVTVPIEDRVRWHRA